jgi:hypothetical protein
MAYLSRPATADSKISPGVVVADNGAGQVTAASSALIPPLGVAATLANAAGDEIAIVTDSGDGRLVLTQQAGVAAIAIGDRVMADVGGVVKFDPTALGVAGDVIHSCGIARSASTNPGDGLEIYVTFDSVVRL